MAGKSFISKFFDQPTSLQNYADSAEMLSAVPWQKPVNLGKPMDNDLREAFREVVEAYQSAVLSVSRDRVMKSAMPSLN